MATRDQLTNVLTRRAFVDRATAILESGAGGGEAISLLMLDIDHFKSVNDTYGHPGGDKVLATVAKRIERCVKIGDLVGRLGGEEFAVLLPGCAPSDAMAVAERIRRAVGSTPFQTGEKRRLKVTVSIGATSAGLARHKLDRLLGVADTALYRAKKSGRDQAVFLEGAAPV
jgi:diguanylate cyclase (GGDEF)-like protein